LSADHLVFTVDLLDYEKIAELVVEIVKESGRIDGLVNCAGISTTMPLNVISPQKLEHIFQTNVIGAINLSKYVIKPAHFCEKGGSVIFISSVMGVAGEAGKTLYSITKGALISAVRSMAVELSPRRIRVNAISPGVVETPMSKAAIYNRDESSFSRIREMHPLGIGQPEDVANACLFMLSDASKWITGTNLIVDGGYLAR
ncbi:MAG: SDR family oxidoreductase, partial [Bacteroidales bacterium]|nr:SDR family oxidoreductase [Bacteroidales bacterium]